MLPGTDFGRSPDELYLRLAYVDFDGGKAMEHVGQLDPNAKPESSQVSDFVHVACPNVATGIERVCQWITDLQSRNNNIEDAQYS